MIVDPKRGLRRGVALAVVLGLSASASACAGIGAKPWDRDLLAEPAMQLNAHPNLTAANEHIYFSKEGSSGGRTFDGGGCGCN